MRALYWRGTGRRTRSQYVNGKEISTRKTEDSGSIKRIMRKIIFNLYNWIKHKFNRHSIELDLRISNYEHAIKYLLKKHINIKDACNEYIALTGKARATFFRNKRKIYI